MKTNTNHLNHQTPPGPPERSRISASGVMWLLFVLLLFGQTSPVSSQEQAPNPEARPAPPQDVIVIEPSSSATQRRIYIPNDELDLLIERDRKGVLMPQTEFDELFELASKNASSSKPASADYVLSRAEYLAHLDGSLIRIKAKIEFTQFVEEWVSIPLSIGALSVEKATLGEQPARLGRQADDRRTILLLNRETGKHVLELDLTTEVSSTGVEKLTTLTLPPIPVGTFTLHLEAGQHLLVDGLSLTRPAEHDQPADYQIPIGGRAELSLHVTDRPSEQTTDALVFATTAYGVLVSPGEVTWNTQTSLQVFGQPINRVTFTIPKPLEIADVTSPGLEAWELTDSTAGEPSTILTLSYRQPIRGERTVQLRGVMTTPAEEAWRVPTLTIGNITSHIGRLIVRYPAGVRLQVAEIKGARPSEAAIEIPAGEETYSQALLYDIWQQDFTLRFLTQQKQREVQAALSTILEVNNTGADLQLAATVESRFAPLFELEIKLPSEWVVREMLMNGQPVKWQIVSSEAGTNELHIPISPPLNPGQEATFKLTSHRDLENWPVETDVVAFAIPEVTLPQAGVVEGTYVVKADDDLDVAPLELTGLDPVFLNLAGERLGYRYQDTHFTGQLEVSRKPTRLSAQTLIFARINRQTSHVAYQATITTQGGGTKSLQLSLSELTGTDLRFELLNHNARIVEQIPAAPKDGERIWTLRFDQRLQGTFTLAVEAELPRPDAAAELTLSPLKVIGADRQNGYIAWEASEDQQLNIAAVDDQNQPLSEVDPLDLPPSRYVPQERIVSVYRFVSTAYKMTAKEQRYEKHAVPTAVCYSAAIDSILGETGEWQHRAVYRLSATSVQSLEVTLPEAELWAAIIDGNPIEVRHVKEAYSISLPAIPDAAAVRVVELYYRNQTDELKTFGKLQQQLPALAIVGGSGEPQPLTILDQNWSVHYPEHVLVIESDGRFEPTDALDRPSLLGQLQTALTTLTIHDVAQKAPLLGGIAFFALLLTLAARKGRFWLSCGALVLIGGIGIIVFSRSLHEGSVNVDFSGGTESSIHLDDDERERLASLGYASKASPPTAGAAAMPGVDFDFNVQEGLPAPAKPMATPDQFEGAEAPSAATAEPQSEAAPADEREKLDANRESLARRDKDQSEKKRSMSAVGEPEFRLQLGEKPMAGEDKPRDSKELGDAGNNILDGAAAFGVEITNGNITDNTFTMPIQQRQEVDQSANPQWELQQGALQSHTVSGKLGGLLSLTIPFQPPQGSLSKTFRYLGDQLGGEANDLDFSYEDRETRDVFRMFLVLLILLPLWLFRRRPLAFRLVYVALGIAVPLALIPIVPVRWQIYLDGLFMGALWGIVLMVVLSILNCCQSSVCCYSTFKQKLTTKLWSIIVPLAVAVGQFSLSPCDLSAQDAAQNATPAEEIKIALPPLGPLPIDPNSLQVYIPYEPGSDPLAAERVFLPYATFVKLWNEAHPDQKLTAPSAIEPIVTESLYSAKLSSIDASPTTVVAVNARLAIYNFREGQSIVTLPLHGIALRAAKLNGEPAAILAPTADIPQHRLTLSAVGLNVLDLEFDLPLKLAGAAGQFILPLEPVASGRLTFALPAADLNVRINGSKSAYRLRKENEQAFVDIPIDQGGDITVAWQPEETRGMVDTTVLTDTSTAVSMDDSGLTLSQGFIFSVKQGSISELNFSMPEPLRLRRIDGLDIGGWEIQGLGDERTLRLFLRRKVNDQTTLQIELFHEADVTEETLTIALPLCVPKDVTRETGTIGLFAEKQFTLRLGQVDGLQQSEIGSYQEVVPLRHLPTPPQAVYRYRMPVPTLSLLLSRRKPESRVRAEHGVYIGQRKQHLTTHLLYDLTGAPRSVLPVRLPEGYLVLEVFATGLVDWSQTLSAEGDAQILLLEMDSPKTGAVEVILSGTVARDPAEASTAIDLPFPIEVNRFEATVAVWADNVYTTQLQEFAGWRSIAPEQLPQGLRERNSQPVQLAFTSVEADPDLILIDLIREVPVMSADSLSVVTVSEIAVTYALAMQWKITKAAADTFQFTTPGWLKGKLDFQIGGLRQVTQTELPDKRIRWKITLQDAVHQTLFLTAIATLPPSTNAEVLLPALEFEQSPAGGEEAESPPLATQRHYILTVNQSRNQLAPLDENLVELVTREDVPLVIPDLIAQQATQIVRLRQAQTAPKLTLQRFEERKGVTASVNLSELMSVIERNGSWRTAAVYRIKNRSRQFLALWIPEEARILSVFVQDQASRPVEAERNGKTMHLIALPKISEADLSISVKIVIGGTLDNGPLPKGFRISAKEIDLPAPQVVSMQDDPEYGLPVAQTQWTVYLPDDLEVSPIDDANRNNLELLDDEEPTLVQEEWLYREASELASVLDNSDSMRSKQKAFSNLKEIQRNIYSYEQQRSGKGVRDETEQRLNEQKVQLDNVIMNNSIIANEVITDFDGDLDARNYRQLREQSQLFIDENGGVGIPGLRTESSQQPISNYSGEQLQKQVEEQLSAKSGKQGEPAKDSNPRARRMAQSRGNLDELNTFLENKKNESAAQMKSPQQQLHLINPSGQSVRGSMGGMGGGMGGMGGVPGNANDRELVGPENYDRPGTIVGLGPDGYATIDHIAINGLTLTPGWTQRGGLSLPIDIPTAGQKLVFSKVSGSPKLALSLRTRESVSTGLGFVWTLVWLGMAALLVLTWWRFGSISNIMHRLPEFLLVVGLVGYFLVPTHFGWLTAMFLLSFIIGAVALGIRYRKPTVTVG
ncbi:MAG: hypothetical protein ACKVT0_11210 [Planctomycetaceae bacterium]